MKNLRSVERTLFFSSPTWPRMLFFPLLPGPMLLWKHYSCNSDKLLHQPESTGGQTPSPLSIVKPSAFTSPVSQMHLGSLFIVFHAHSAIMESGYINIKLTS